MYAATCTRPDIAYSVHQLCKVMQKPTPAVLAESGALSMRQGRFVKSFVSARRAAERLQNDMDMVMGGLPKGFL